MLLRILILIYLVLAPSAYSATPKTVKRRPPLQPIRPAPRLLKVKYNSLLGLHLAGGSALVTGGQLGFPVSRSGHLFAGPELNFSLFSPGSLLSLLGTVWYEIPLGEAPKLHLSVGAALGLTIPSRLVRYEQPTYMVLLDLALSQEMDQDVFIRGQLRPGVVGKYFGLMMNLNVMFLFR